MTTAWHGMAWRDGTGVDACCLPYLSYRMLPVVASIVVI